MAKALRIKKGYCIDTPTGHQEVICRHGDSDTAFIVHNFNEDGFYTHASILTDREIIHAEHDSTRELYDRVIFDD